MTSRSSPSGTPPCEALRPFASRSSLRAGRDAPARGTCSRGDREPETGLAGPEVSLEPEALGPRPARLGSRRRSRRRERRDAWRHLRVERFMLFLAPDAVKAGQTERAGPLMETGPSVRR